MPLVVAAVLALGACGVRLETPPPPPPVPDAAETLRQETVADAVLLQELAATTEHPDPAVQVLVDAVGTAAAAHVDALGGVYDPGTEPSGAVPDPAAAAPSPAAAATPSGAGQDAVQDDDRVRDDDAGQDDDEPTGPAADDAVAHLAATLAETAATALAAADTAEDGATARLVGAVATNRLLLGERLAAAVGSEPAPDVEGTAAWAPGDVPPLEGSDVLALVTGEDLAGQAWEVVAARRDGDGRTAAADRAATHRARAQAWAEATDVAGSGLDPRRASYALPAGLLSGDAAAAAVDLADLETRLADAYAALVARAGTGTRTPLVVASADAARAAAALTGDVPEFPGMPELAG